MKNIIYLASLLFIIMFASSCKEELPDNNCCTCTAPFTESGAGAMSFDLNGTTWSPCNTNEKNGTSPGLSSQRDPTTGYLHIKSQKFVNGEEETVYLHFLYPKKGIIPHAEPGKFGLTQGLITMELFANNPEIKENGNYSSSKELFYLMEITKVDTINKIISGNFSCTLTLTGSPKTDTIHIKNGRFDTRYL